MYKLPKLPYLYQDLEPFIDTHTMGLHLKKHQKNYLNNLNKLLKKNNYQYQYSLTELLYHLNEFPLNDQEDILFNLGGVLNHNLYFKSIGPNNEEPTGKLLDAIKKKYQNLENFFKVFKQMALSIKGSGYTFLVLNNNELELINVPNQITPFSLGMIPLLNIDMWEHAYYLNYKNDKEKYIDNFYEIIDFSYANQLFNNLVK